jgi:hypothetical protein
VCVKGREVFRNYYIKKEGSTALPEEKVRRGVKGERVCLSLCVLVAAIETEKWCK